jgi:hypothetical protein
VLLKHNKQQEKEQEIELEKLMQLSQATLLPFHSLSKPNLEEMGILSIFTGKHSFASQVVACGLLFASGDVIAQKAIERKSTIDWHRTLRLTTYGTAVAV